MDLRGLLIYLRPSILQLFYSGVVALLASTYWCRDQLLYALTSSSQTTPSDFTGAIGQIVNNLTENTTGGFLSLALFWVLIALLMLAVIYESINIFIVFRNDFTIVSTYTKSRRFMRWLARSVFTRLVWAIGFLTLVIISFMILIPFWHSLLNQPSEDFFNWTSIALELIGFISLTINIYLLWKWAVLVLPRFNQS